MDWYWIEVTRDGQFTRYVDTWEAMRETIARTWPDASITGAGFVTEVWQGWPRQSPLLATFIAMPVTSWPRLPERL